MPQRSSEHACRRALAWGWKTHLGGVERACAHARRPPLLICSPKPSPPLLLTAASLSRVWQEEMEQGALPAKLVMPPTKGDWKGTVDHLSWKLHTEDIKGASNML